jgi:hypothetical protein
METLQQAAREIPAPPMLLLPAPVQAEPLPSVVNPELAEYLRSRPQISPIRQTLSDPGLWWASTWLGVSAFAFMLGLNDPFEVTLETNPNYPGILQQGMSTFGLLSAASATDLIATGRYQTYKDMADFQRGVDPKEIIARADMSKENALTRFFNWRMNYTYNFVSAFPAAMCLMMVASGIANKRWGEAATGLLLLPGYAAQLMPEKHYREKEPAQPVIISDPTAAKSGWLKRAFDAVAASAPGRAVKFVFGQPLLLSAVLMSWRLLPALVNALYKGDAPLAAVYGLSAGMLMFMANTTKDAIGRYRGSILDPRRENGLEIARTLLEGRFSSIPQAEPKPACN